MSEDILPCSQNPTVLSHAAYVDFSPYPHFPFSKTRFI